MGRFTWCFSFGAFTQCPNSRAKVPQKIKSRKLSYNPASLLLGIHAKEMILLSQRNTCTLLFILALFHYLQQRRHGDNTSSQPSMGDSTKNTINTIQL